MITGLLSKLLKKKGIDNVETLTQEEQDTFMSWQAVLRGDVLTVEMLKEFCKSQVKIIETKFAEADTKNDTYYKACLHVYLTLLKVIEAPEQERESLEKYLTQLIK